MSAWAVLRATVVVATVLIAGSSAARAETSAPAELRVVRSLSLGSLPPAPDDPSNAYDTDPRAARLGRRLFFDPRLSANGALSCATCHPPGGGFQDRKPVAEGLGKLTRRVMPLAGVAYGTWFFWDGRKDSLWAQAVTPIENPLELGMTRAGVAALVSAHYRKDYEGVFGDLPKPGADTAATTRVFVNAGKAIAAFVRTIVPTPARFDRWAEATLAGKTPGTDGTLSAAELRGLRLFVGRAQCTNCHAGPLFTNGEFHFTRVPQPHGDRGRSDLILQVRSDELNCLGPFSDATPDACGALRFADPDTRDTLQAFKTPSLRNVAVRAPYMNAGQLATLGDVLRLYRDKSHGIKELAHDDLTDADLADLEAFLGTLTSPIAALAADE